MGVLEFFCIRKKENPICKQISWQKQPHLLLSKQWQFHCVILCVPDLIFLVWASDISWISLSYRIFPFTQDRCFVIVIFWNISCLFFCTCTWNFLWCSGNPCGVNFWVEFCSIHREFVFILCFVGSFGFCPVSDIFLALFWVLSLGVSVGSGSVLLSAPPAAQHTHQCRDGLISQSLHMEFQQLPGSPSLSQHCRSSSHLL